MNRGLGAFAPVLAFSFALISGLPARAEVSEITVAQQYGVSFIPLMLFMGVLFGFFWGVLMALAFLIWLIVGEGLQLGQGGHVDAPAAFRGPSGRPASVGVSSCARCP